MNQFAIAFVSKRQPIFQSFILSACRELSITVLCSKMTKLWIFYPTRQKFYGISATKRSGPVRVCVCACVCGCMRGYACGCVWGGVRVRVVRVLMLSGPVDRSLFFLEGWSSSFCFSGNFHDPGPNPTNGLQACIYKLVNTSVFSSPLKSLA